MAYHQRQPPSCLTLPLKLRQNLGDSSPDDESEQIASKSVQTSGLGNMTCCIVPAKQSYSAEPQEPTPYPPNMRGRMVIKLFSCGALVGVT